MQLANYFLPNHEHDFPRQFTITGSVYINVMV